MDVLGPPARRIGVRRVSQARQVAPRAVDVKQQVSASASEPSPDERIALESVDIVPLPSPLVEKSNVVPVSSLESFISLEAEPAKRDTGFFSLDKTQSLWLLNLVSFAYGSNTTFVKETIEGSHLEPSVICAMRYSLAMVLVLPALIAPGVRNISWNLSLELGFALFCAYQSQSQQLMTETASQGSIMLAVFILLVPVVELAFGRAFTRKKLVSLLVALFGISLLSIGGSSAEAPEVAVKTIMGIPEGSLWGLGSAIAFAVHLVRSEMRQHEAANVGQLAAGQLAVCGMLSLGLLGVQAATDPHIAQELDVGKIASQMPWVPFLVSSVIGTVLGQCGELVAVGKVPASQASLTLSLVTVWGLMFGAVFNHDRLTPLSWAGAAIIIGATIVPKALDVFADRKQASSEASARDEALAGSPRLSMTSEDFVRTTVSATMLAATPVMTDAGLLATGRAVAGRALTGALSAEGGSFLAGAGAAAEAGAAGAAAAAEAAGAAGAGVAAGAAGAAASAAGVAATGAAATGATAAATGAAATGTATAAAATSAGIAGGLAMAAGAASTAAGGAAAAGGVAGAAAATGAAAAGTAAAAGAGAAATGSTAAGLAMAGGAAAAAAAAVASGAVSGDDVANVITGASDVLSSGAGALNAAGSTGITDATQAVIEGVRSVGTAMADSGSSDPAALAQAAQAAQNSAAAAADGLGATQVLSDAAQAARDTVGSKLKAE